LKIFIAAVLLIGINLFTIVPLISRTSEEDIGKNIKHLKKHQWFQDLLSNEVYKELIIQDKYVRKTIGKFNSEKLDKKSFKNKYQNKLQNILHQKTNRMA